MEPCSARAGTAAVGDLGIGTIAGALRLHVVEITTLEGGEGEEPNVRLRLTP